MAGACLTGMQICLSDAVHKTAESEHTPTSNCQEEVQQYMLTFLEILSSSEKGDVIYKYVAAVGATRVVDH